MERLIGELAASAAPVKRLKPPMWRAGAWLAAVAAVVAVAVFGFSNLHLFMERAQNPKLVLELVGTALTGILAVIAAFYLSLPDRSPAWALLPIPPFVLWVASSGYNCYRHWIVYGPDGWGLGDSAACFRFILLASIPLGISLVLILRRAYPLTPVRVALMGGLGVAAISAFVLQFFHPFDVTFMDLGVHMVAVGLVAALTGAAEGLIARRT
jgi:hypothetical protein